jgi:hypothetical protein
MALIERITECLRIDFADFLADHFGLDTNEVSDVIGDYLRISPDPNQERKQIIKKSPPTKPLNIAIKPAKSSVKTCQFLITRGQRENKQCETHVRGSGVYCSKHKVRKSVQKKNHS